MEKSVHEETLPIIPLLSAAQESVLVPEREEQEQQNLQKHYYAVTCKCGHVGRRRYIPITFVILTENGKEASAIARNYPRVKHHNKFAILSCRRIDETEAAILMSRNDEDPYLHCKSNRDQDLYPEIMERVIHEEVVPIMSKKKTKAFSKRYLDDKKSRRRAIWQDYSEDCLD